MKLLFVCKSNVARSQFAEGIFNSLTKKHKATSCGVDVEEKYFGKKLSETTKYVVPVMKEIGIDVSNHKSKQITEERVTSVDKVIVMNEKERCPGYLLNNPKVVFWDIVDPRHGGIEDQRVVRDEIKRRVEALLKEIG